MKKIILYLLFCLIGWESLGQITFQKKYYSISSYQKAYKVQTASDGGFIIAGVNNVSGNENGVLLKTDSLGDVIWGNQYGNESSEVFRNVEEISGGGYLAIGNRNDQGIVGMLIVKTDANGNHVWNQYIQRLSGTFYDTLTDAKELPDGSFILIGSQYDRIYLLKIDASGNRLWSKKFGNTGCIAKMLRLTGDGGFMIAGRTTSASDVTVMKMDSLGTIQWSKKYSSAGNIGDIPIGMRVNNDGNTMVVYRMYPSSLGIIKLATSGDTLWKKVYTISTGTYFENAASTNNGGFVIAGFTNVTNPSGPYLLKIDSVGNVEWTKTYGIPSINRYFSSVEQLPNGGYIIAGVQEDSILLIRTDSLGNSCQNGPSFMLQPVDTGMVILNFNYPYTGPDTMYTIALTDANAFNARTDCLIINIEENSHPDGSFTLYPNPTTGTFKIQTPQLKNSQLEIFNMLGEKIYSDLLKEETIELNARAGIYFVRVSDGEKVYTQKLVVE
jgi:hypothetical protein